MPTHNSNLHFYLIPGMGANAQLYAHYQLPGEIHVLDWPAQGNSTTLADYAKILAENITTENNVIVGSSMGGMVATELSHLLHPKATILLSAPCSHQQFPLLLRALKHIGLHGLLRPNQIYRLAKSADLFMGFENATHRQMFYDMLKSNGPEFLHFSVKAVLEWQHNGEPTGPYVHILGVRDRLFKSEKMANPIIIKDAGHFATFEKSDLICRLINCYVESEFDATETRLKSQLQWPSEMV
jgi:pimeloyl-ACP methyl ester carboxylesterase